MRCASLSIIVENTHARHVSQPLRIPRSAATKRTATGPIHLACTLSTHEAWIGTHVVRMWYACGTHVVRMATVWAHRRTGWAHMMATGWVGVVPAWRPLSL